MQIPDLNLLVALDALLQEGSVVGAAQRMGLSGPAMSRALARIRAATGDPILVKAGRRMVPTPRALALRDEVRGALDAARRVLRPERELDLATLDRRFNLHANDTFTSSFGGALLDRVRRDAPRAVLRMLPESATEDDVLRDGDTDLYISAMRPLGGDFHVQPLFSTRFVGLARDDHPIFDDPITPARFASFDQISVSRRGRVSGPIDRALGELGLQRTVALVAPTFYSAVFALGNSGLVLPLPAHVARSVSDMGLRVRAFDLPLTLDEIVIVQAWHPRFQNDPAHQWLRRVIRDACGRAPTDGEGCADDALVPDDAQARSKQAGGAVRP
ncbi:LysR family transcriptional regulator [Burkholderia sp. FERM BP-3421]|jgi:DNA-binding transcriptional LysR family regulator|uniref:LysR family transcriptional regulator n=1 Tax=Burkholderia sp. FERM BP-3421 TaxID=1494466 RepID=UPI0023602622|nr:LysR family transcriptional regulator [Burkholderia sp. FERM BP-3421]WDD92977.1 LysR family transcriptional regulator [Burkholderia sp. FERM BP-3421]